MNIGKLKRSTQIAIMTGTGSGAVEKTISGTSPLTLSDSVAGNILGITVKGHSEVVDGAIKSIGDVGTPPTLGITSKDGAGQGTAATITTGLPLRSVSDSITDELTNTKVIKKCGKLKGSDVSWYSYSIQGVFLSDEINGIGRSNGLSSKYNFTNVNIADLPDNSFVIWPNNRIYLKDTAYTDAQTFTAAVADVEFIYPLVTPTETSLSTAEKSALSVLSTYDPTTVISVTDNPSITVKYMGKNITRTAPKKRSSRKKKA
mgnify:CR=1 FL=1